MQSRTSVLGIAFACCALTGCATAKVASNPPASTTQITFAVVDESQAPRIGKAQHSHAALIDPKDLGKVDPSKRSGDFGLWK